MPGNRRHGGPQGHLGDRRGGEVGESMVRSLYCVSSVGRNGWPIVDMLSKFRTK